MDTEGSRDPQTLLPDAVLVGYGDAGRERVELHHGGDARVPVEEDLIVQPGDTCGGTGGSQGSVPRDILPEGRGSDPPSFPVPPLSSSSPPPVLTNRPPNTLLLQEPAQIPAS